MFPCHQFLTKKNTNHCFLKFFISLDSDYFTKNFLKNIFYIFLHLKYLRNLINKKYFIFIIIVLYVLYIVSLIYKSLCKRYNIIIFYEKDVLH